MAKAIKGVFKIVRGLEAELPILRIGELGYATDSNTLFVGDPDDGNVKINFNNEDRGMLNTVFKEMDKKVDVEPGKGLSTNDLTNELLEKILESVSENFVINKIAEAQLDVDGSGVDLSGLASKDDLDGKVDKKIGYSLISDAELIRLASVSNYDDTDIKKDINKKADINHQHDQYLTSIPSQYVTNTQLTAKGYATTSSVNATLSIYAKSSAIPTKISQLTDDVGYLISIPEEYVTDSELNIVLAPYALIADIPTKVGQLANDAGYLTSIPEEYITETELNDKGYATTTEVDQKIAEAAINGAVDLSGYALKTEIPTDISQLNNDSNYLTAIPYEYVTETELEAELINKVDKEAGKGLSTNDLTNEMVVKIDNAATQAYVTNAIAEARLDGSDVDLSGYATKDELNEKAPLTHSHIISDVSDLQTALDSKVDAVSGKSLVSDTEIARLANVDNYDDSEIRGLIPTKVSQLINDRNYLNSVPSEYVTETELTDKGYATITEVDQKITEAVTNGTVDLSGYALKTEIPTKTSQLNNDSNYLTSIPSEYITETELNTSLSNKVDKVSGKGLSTNDLTNEMVTKIDNAATQAYVTNAIAEARLDGSDVDLSGYATKDELNEKAPLTHSHNISDVSDLQTSLSNKVDKEAGYSLVSDTEIARLANVDNYDDTEVRGLIPTKTSQLTNDSNYLTSIPSEYVTETELQTSLDSKVDKVSGKGLSTNDLTNEMVTKIDNAATQAYVTNAIAEARLDGSDVDLSGYATKDELNEKAPLTHSHNMTDVSDLQAALDSKVDKEAGYSLVSDTEIARLANVDNYDDSEIRGLIPTKTSQLNNDSNFISSNDEIDADKINGKIISGPMTKEEYEALADKDPNTIYLVDDDTIITGIPSYTTTDANKLLAVNSDGNALAWVDVPSGSGLTTEQVQQLTTAYEHSQTPHITTGEVNTAVQTYVNNNISLLKGDKGDKGEKGDTGANGRDGVNAINPSFTIGTVTTLPSSSNATVTLTGTYPNLVLNFGIPRGADGSSGGTDEPVDDTPYMYYGRLSFEDIGGKVIQYNQITEAMINKGVTDGKLTKTASKTMGKTSLGEFAETADLDYIIIVVPASKNYIVTKDNGIGGKMVFDEETAGANGVDITINNVACKLYGEILLSQGQYFIYVD